MSKMLGVRVSEDDLEEFINLCTEQGTTPNDAVRAFIKTAIHSGEVPKMELPDEIAERVDELLAEKLGTGISSDESLALAVKSLEFRVNALTERVNRIEKEPPSEKPETTKSLTLGELARRLKTSKEMISHQGFRHSPDEFAAWSAARDHDGTAWKWNGGERREMRFKPVPRD